MSKHELAKPLAQGTRLGRDFVELSGKGICPNGRGVGRVNNLGLFQPSQKVLAVGQPLDHRACRRPDGVQKIETGVISDEHWRGSAIRYSQFVFVAFRHAFLHKRYADNTIRTYLLQTTLKGYATNKLLQSIAIAAARTRSLPTSAIGANRQRELKHGPSGRICRRPKPSSVSFDNRTADRQPYAQTARLSCIESVEKAIKSLRIQPWARVSHCNQYAGPFRFDQAFVLERMFLRLTGDLSHFLRTDPQFSRTLAHSTHS